MEKQINTITDKDIQNYLETSAPLKNYYIYQVYGDENNSMISVIKNGVAYSIMDDNDERVEVCIDFLKRHGAPIFKTPETEDAYIEEFNRKNLQNS